MRFLIASIIAVRAHKEGEAISIMGADINEGRPLTTKELEERGDALVIRAIVDDIKGAVTEWERDSERLGKPFATTVGEAEFKRRISDLIGGIGSEKVETVKAGLDAETVKRIKTLQNRVAREGPFYKMITKSWPSGGKVFLSNGMMYWPHWDLKVQYGFEASSRCVWNLAGMRHMSFRVNHFVNRQIPLCLHEGLEREPVQAFTEGKKIHVTVTGRGWMYVQCGSLGSFEAHQEELRGPLKIEYWGNKIFKRNVARLGKIHLERADRPLTGDVYDRERAQTLCAKFAQGRRFFKEILDQVGPDTVVEQPPRYMPTKDLVNKFLAAL
jgi:hypothetical protein